MNRRAFGEADAIGLFGEAAPPEGGLPASVDEYGFDDETAFIADGPIVLSALTPPTPDAGLIFIPAAVGLCTGAFWIVVDRTGVEVDIALLLVVDVLERTPVLDASELVVGDEGAPSFELPLLEVVGDEEVRREREAGEEAPAGGERGSRGACENVGIEIACQPRFSIVCLSLARALPSTYPLAFWRRWLLRRRRAS